MHLNVLGLGVPTGVRFRMGLKLGAAGSAYLPYYSLLYDLCIALGRNSSLVAQCTLWRTKKPDLMEGETDTIDGPGDLLL